MTKAMPFLRKYDITFLRPPPFRPEIFSSAAPRRAVPVMSCPLPASGLSTSGG